jgi:hypothetical protein
MGGQRSRTAWASFSPSMLPGMLMSVKKQGDIAPRFQQDNRFVRIPGLDRNEPRFLDDLDGQHPQK